MRLLVASVVVSIVACGFRPNATTGDSADGSSSSGSDGSGSNGSGSDTVMMTSFGERPTAEHQTVTTDTYLDSSNITQTHGGTGIYIDQSPTVNGLLRFDLSALPTTATIVDAELEVTTTSDSLESGTLDVYEALEAWNPMFATWLVRDNATTWTTAGASPPGSRGATMIGSVFPSVDLTAYAFPLDTATVQRWVTTPASNHGMVLISTSPTGNGVTLSDSSDATLAARPILRVHYR